MQNSKSLNGASDECRIENAGLTLIVSRVLLFGVVLSSTIIGSGVLLSFCHSSSQQTDRQLPYTFPQIVSGLLILQPEAVILLGLIVLIATPVLRVAVSIVAFAFEHDRMFVMISSIVMMILLVSFLLGKGGV